MTKQYMLTILITILIIILFVLIFFDIVLFVDSLDQLQPYLADKLSLPKWTGFGQDVEAIIPPTPVGYTGNIEPIVKFRPAKTLWEWLDLLLVPFALAIITIIFNRSLKNRELAIQKQRSDFDHYISTERHNLSIVQKYLDDISELLVKEKLLEKKDDSNSPLVNVAQTKTINAIRALGSDVNRKDSIFQSLRDARLADCILVGSWLKKVNLSGVNLSSINFYKADLEQAILRGAFLRGANLNEANLVKADLSKANLGKATFVNADLTGAKLNGAHVTKQQLSKSKSLDGAILPNGKVFRNLVDLKIIDLPRNKKG